MGQNKRARVEPPGHSRSSSDDPTSGPGGSGGAAYFNSSSSSYRHQQPYHAGSVNHQYGSYFVGSQTSPPPSFIPLQQEYSTRGTASSPATGSGGPTAAGGGAGGGAGGAGGGHYGARQQQYDPSLYSPSIIRHPHQAQQHGNGPGGGGSDMYPVFQLEADGGQRQSTVTPSQPFGIEWPIHSSNSAAAAAAASAATAPSGPASSGADLFFFPRLF
jgi:MADS-box transcription factor